MKKTVCIRANVAPLNMKSSDRQTILATIARANNEARMLMIKEVVSVLERFGVEHKVHPQKNIPTAMIEVDERLDVAVINAIEELSSVEVCVNAQK